MTATPLTLDGGTEVRPVDNVESANVVPLRRRQRETTRSGGAEDRIPALSALDSAAEYVLVVRSGDSLRVFSEGGLTAQDADGRELHPSHEGEELEAALPLLVGRVEDGEVLEPSAQDTTAPAAPIEAPVATDAESLFGSILDLDETNKVADLVRGSIVADGPAAAEEAPEESPEAYLSIALVLPDGRRITADHTVLLGRSPSARPEDSEAETVALASNLTDISRNHLELVFDGAALLARDLDSTNGTVLTRPGQAPRLIPTEEAVRILPGDSLNLGGSATVDIEGLR